MAEGLAGQTPAAVLNAATRQLARSSRIHAVFAGDRLQLRERAPVRFAVITLVSGILVTFAGVFAAYAPVQVGGLVLGPLLIVGAIGSVVGARLVVDPVRIRGRDAAMRAVDRPSVDLTNVRFERDSDEAGVTTKLTIEVRAGAAIAVIDVTVLDPREGALLARQIHALGLGIAAWLRLDFTADEVGPGPDRSNSVVVTAIDALGAALELLAIDG